MSDLNTGFAYNAIRNRMIFQDDKINFRRNNFRFMTFQITGKWIPLCCINGLIVFVDVIVEDKFSSIQVKAMCPQVFSDTLLPELKLVITSHTLMI